MQFKNFGSFIFAVLKGRMWMLLFLSLYYAIFAIDPNDLTGEMMKNMAITNRTLKWKKGSYGFQHFSHERCSGGKLVRATGYVLGRCLHISGLSGPAHRSVEYTSCDEDSVVIKYCTNSSDCSENCISYYLPFIYDECGDTVPICSRNENGWEDYEFNWHLL